MVRSLCFGLGGRRWEVASLARPTGGERLRDVGHERETPADKRRASGKFGVVFRMPAAAIADTIAECQTDELRLTHALK